MLAVLFILCTLLPTSLCKAAVPVDNVPTPAATLADLRLQFREEVLSLREEMIELMGPTALLTLSWAVRDLADDVKGYKALLEQQGQLLEQQGQQLEKLEQQLEQQGQQLERQGQKGELLEQQGEQLLAKSDMIREEVKEEMGAVRSRLNSTRDEVRLISQHKLTWQNNTAGGRYFSDFVVDGVYRMTHDESGMNPIAHTADGAGPNQVIMIHLGGIFKLHTVKLWKRTHTCCDSRYPGLHVYAQDDNRTTLIGVLSDVKFLYDLRVPDNVFASTVYVKTFQSQSVNLLEFQVFGSGPFARSEI